jgi:hypothetical protein
MWVRKRAVLGQKDLCYRAVTPTNPKDSPGTSPPQTPSRPADPSLEVCAKIREARKRHDYYQKQSLSHAELELLAARQALLYAKMGYGSIRTQALMASTYRHLEQSRHVVQEAKASYDRLADDLIGKVETPWPACEAPQIEKGSSPPAAPTLPVQAAPTLPVQEDRVFRQCAQAALVMLGIWDGPMDGEDSPPWTKVWEHYLDHHRETSHDHRQATIRTVINQDLAAKGNQINWDKCGS